MREWLSGGAPPCQGGGRGFDPRLALFYFVRKSVFIWLPLFLQKDMAPPGTMSFSSFKIC